MSIKGTLAFAKVMAHCGGSPEAAMSVIAREVADSPSDPARWALFEELRRELPAEVSAGIAAADTIGPVVARSYLAFVDGEMDDAAMSIGSMTGFQPDIAWADAPWFTDDRFLGGVSPAAFAEATMRINDYGHDLSAVREQLAPWFRAIDEISARKPDADAMARMAILLRECGRTDASFELCDRADAVERVPFTEVVRAGTWRRVGDLTQTAAAFRRALALDPDNWSMYLDLADLAAERGDFAEAAELATHGEELEPGDVTMRAAAAAYRARATGSAQDLAVFIELATQVGEPYRSTLAERAQPAQGPTPPTRSIR